MDNLTVLALLRRLQEQVSEVTKQAGPEGPVGPQGPQGERGADGIQGERGPAGERGSDGLQGPQGADGEQGEDGVGVTSVSQAADGDLVFHLSDGTESVVELPLGLSTGSETSVFVKHAGETTSGSGGGGGGGGQGSLTNPEFTYTNGLLTRVDYNHGEYKTLAYNTDDQLITVTLFSHNGNTLSTKTLTYNADGTLASVSET